jgi:3-methylfumaryl-CoA hydratase
MNTQVDTSAAEVTDDHCALPLVRRLAAMLDRDPARLREGDALPRGWHVVMFNPPTPQSQLRLDGAAVLGVVLPDIGLPRLMLGGRQVSFNRDIAIGAHVRRESRQGGVRMKEGRSGRFALVSVEHRIFVAGQSEPALVETNEYVLREASPPASAAAGPAGAPSATAAPITARPAPDATRTLVPDEQLLFRYSSITDNPHRIHYDQPYARGVEGYPALVVNGSIPAMFLLELFRQASGREPAAFSSRNVAPMFCGRALTLNARNEAAAWRLWAENESGQATFEARAE